jgi:hypothetical protein
MFITFVKFYSTSQGVSSTCLELHVCPQAFLAAAQASGILQIVDVTEQRANEHKTSCCNRTPGDKHVVPNK